MFGIGMSEIVIILGVALLVFGPDKLPEIARSVSKGLRDLRRASDDLRNTVTQVIDDAPEPPPRVKASAGTPAALDPTAAPPTAPAAPPQIADSNLVATTASPIVPVAAVAAAGAEPRGPMAFHRTANEAPTASTHPAPSTNAANGEGGDHG